MSVDLKALVLLGARARLAELVAETDALLKTFPELNAGDKNAPQRTATVLTAGPRKRARHKRPHMSLEQRAAASKRMKAYWATKHKAKK